MVKKRIRKVTQPRARRGDPYHVPGIGGDIHPNVKVAHAQARRGDAYHVPGIGDIHPNVLPSGPLLLSKKGEKLLKQLIEDHNQNVDALNKQTS
jgi:hypothetical protein